MHVLLCEIENQLFVFRYLLTYLPHFPYLQDLSASVRNRLYDAVATLLHQNSHTERCLMWVLALLRGPSALLNEVVGHTVRDLREALETVALEASKRGLLASLLKSQINR